MVTPDYHFFARSTSYNVSTDSLLLAMKALALCLHLSLLTISDSFQVQSTNGNHVKVATSMTAASRDGDLSRRTFAQAFSGMAIASIFVGRVEVSQAFASSSITVSDEIKTLDFSLPSYDSISNSKASVSTVEGLAEQFVPKNDTPATTSRKKTKEPKPSSGGNPMGSLLPSMNKSNTKSPKTKSAPAVRAAPKEKEEKPLGIETMDLSLPSYDAGSSKGKSIFSI